MFTSLDEEIHVIVANLQMKTYVFHRREKSRHSPTLKRSRKSVHARAYECNIDFFFVFHILASYIVRLLLAIIIGEEFFFSSPSSLLLQFYVIILNKRERERADTFWCMSFFFLQVPIAMILMYGTMSVNDDHRSCQAENFSS